MKKLSIFPSQPVSIIIRFVVLCSKTIGPGWTLDKSDPTVFNLNLAQSGPESDLSMGPLN